MAALSHGGPRGPRLRLVIVGAGGHGKEVASYVRDLDSCGAGIELLGFIDDVRPPGEFAGSSVLGGMDALRALLDQDDERVLRYVTAVGDNAARRRLAERVAAQAGAALLPCTLIHPTAYVGASSRCGVGTVVAPGAVITTDVVLGDHCIINVRASVSHDSRIGDFASINPGATICGGVTIGANAYIGAGATVINAVTVGAGTIVGGGAVVVHDLPPHVTAVGVPARPIKQHPS